MMQGWLLVGTAGIVCVFIDTAFLGGSLDYVYLKPLYIFDLKDVYLNVGWIFFLYCFVTLNKEDSIVMRTFRLDRFVKDKFKKK